MKVEPFYRGTFAGSFSDSSTEAAIEVEQGYRCIHRGISTEAPSRMEAIEKMMWIVMNLSTMIWL